MSQWISVALKEWAVVVEASLEGPHSLLLRKGSVGAIHRDFRIDHPRFLLFPTYEEGRPEQLLPAWRDKLRRIQSLRPDGSYVILKGYCAVEALWEVRDIGAVLEPAGRMVWSPEYLRGEFPTAGPFCALLVRAYRLSEAREIANLESYGPPRTWVSLVDEISLEAARPVMTDEAFRRLAGDLHRHLG